MNPSPKISVVTVTYNSAATLEETMLSVLNQTYYHIEYIIIDGGSTDGTVDIIRKYADQLAYWVSEPDKGIYDAMNKGIAIATGDYINFMNAGDSFVSSDTIEKVVNRMVLNPSAGVFFGKVIYDENGVLYEPINSVPFIYSTERIKPMGICHQSIFTKTNLAKSHLFNLDYKFAADYNMVSTLFKNGVPFDNVDKVIAKYKVGGYSNQNWKKQYKEVAKINGYSTTNIYVRYYILTNVLKGIILKILRGVKL